MKRTLGVCYYPEHWPEAQWGADAARMTALGLLQRSERKTGAILGLPPRGEESFQSLREKLKLLIPSEREGAGNSEQDNLQR